MIAKIEAEAKMSEEKGEQGTVQIALRIAPDLRERIKSAAEANNRSVNKELIATLEEKYPAPLPSHRDILVMALDFLMEHQLTTRTKADKEAFLSKFDSLPREQAESAAKAASDAIINALDKKVADFRAARAITDHED